MGSGEFDGYIEPSDWWVAGPNNYYLSDKYFNYTHFKYIWEDKYNIAPRFHYAKVSSVDVPEIKNQYLNMWDTQLEKEIHLGSQYPYEPLGRGECLVPESYAVHGYVIGDTLQM